MVLKKGEKTLIRNQFAKTVFFLSFIMLFPYSMLIAQQGAKPQPGGAKPAGSVQTLGDVPPPNQPSASKPAPPNLPPPKQKGAGGAAGSGSSMLDKKIQGAVEATDIELKNILQTLQAESGVNFVVPDGINKKVTFKLENPTVKEVLDVMLPTNGLAYMETENGIRIDTEEKIGKLNQRPAELITKTFTPKYVDIKQVMEAIEGLKSSDGYIVPDPDSQKIIVKDIPEAIEAMEQIIAQLDVENEMRVFNIKYGNVQEIADQLQGVINTQDGELFVNPRLNQIIIKDTPERLDRAAAIIEQLDMEILTKVIPLAFALPEDILPLLESYLTESGWVDYDPRTSRIIIHDIPSVIQQAIELIQKIDIPTQQVYIEADIIQIQQGKSFTFGTSASFGKDIGLNNDASSPTVSTATNTGFFSFNPFLTTSGSGLTLTDVARGNYRVQVDAMVKNNVAEIIASPRLLVEDGGTGSFTLGSQEPYSSRQRGYGGYGYGSSGGGDYYTQQFREVGTSLELETYISEAGYVQMYIRVEDSKPRRVQLANVGEALAIDGSFIETSATVKSGRTVVLGGIINRSKSNSQAGVPVVSNIPILGNLFKNKSTDSKKDKLLVFITPKVVNVDDPYEFSQVDNSQKVLDLQKRGATKFIDNAVDKRYLDWSKEEPNEQMAIDEALKNNKLKENTKLYNQGKDVNSEKEKPSATSKSKKESSKTTKKSSVKKPAEEGVVIMKKPKE